MDEIEGLDYRPKSESKIFTQEYTSQELSELSEDVLQGVNLSQGVSITKSYHTRYMGKMVGRAAFQDVYYPGFITAYNFRRRKDEDGNIFYYIRFYITVKIEENPIGDYTFDVNANFNSRSQFGRMLFDLGYNIGNIDCFHLDSLINMPVWALMTYDDTYEMLKVGSLKYRDLGAVYNLRAPKID